MKKRILTIIIAILTISIIGIYQSDTFTMIKSAMAQDDEPDLCSPAKTRCEYRCETCGTLYIAIKPSDPGRVIFGSLTSDMAPCSECN